MALTPESSISFDPVAVFLRRPLHEVVGASLPKLNAPPSLEPRSIQTLQKLASKYAWASVLDLATSLLAASDDDTDETGALKPHERIICTMYRTLALLQTRQVDRAATAIELLGDLSNDNIKYRYESHPNEYGNQKGSFIPFELHMLALEIRVKQGDFSAILDAYELKHDLCQQNTQTSRERQAIMLSALASYHLKMQQNDAAIDLAKQLVDLCGGSDAWYIYGVVLLYAGNLEGAEAAFEEAYSNSGEKQQAKRHAHKAMHLAARGKFTEAIIAFDDANQHVGGDRHLAVVIANNVSICLLNVGRLAEAIDRLETVIRKGPEFALDEGLVFNLATLYDLAYPDSAIEKKRVLQAICMKFGREGFDFKRL